MNTLWEATLNKSSPRYAEWLKILDDDAVPLDSPYQLKASLGGESAEIYMLSIHQFTADQRLRLIHWVADKSGLNPDEISAEIRSRGFPIRTSDVIVAFDLRAFI